MPDFNYNSNPNYNVDTLNLTKGSGNPVWEERLSAFLPKLIDLFFENQFLMIDSNNHITYTTGQAPIDFLRQFKVSPFAWLDKTRQRILLEQLQEKATTQDLSERIACDVFAVLVKAPGFENITLEELADNLKQKEYEPFPLEKYNFNDLETSVPLSISEGNAEVSSESLQDQPGISIDYYDEINENMANRTPTKEMNKLIGNISPIFVKQELNYFINLHKQDSFFPDLLKPKNLSSSQNSYYNFFSIEQMEFRNISEFPSMQQEFLRRELTKALTSQNLSTYIAAIIVAEKLGIISKKDTGIPDWDNYLREEQIEVPFTLYDDSLFNWPIPRNNQDKPSVLAAYSLEDDSPRDMSQNLNIPPVNNNDITPHIPNTPAPLTIEPVQPNIPDLNIASNIPPQSSDLLNIDMPPLAQTATVQPSITPPPVSNNDITPHIPNTPAPLTIEPVQPNIPDLNIASNIPPQSSDLLNIDMPPLAQTATVQPSITPPPVSNNDITPHIPNNPTPLTIEPEQSDTTINMQDLPNLASVDNLTQNETNLPFDFQSNITKESAIDGLRAEKSRILNGRDITLLTEDEQAQVHELDDALAALQQTPLDNPTSSGLATTGGTKKTHTITQKQTIKNTTNPDNNGPYTEKGDRNTSSPKPGRQIAQIRKRTPKDNKEVQRKETATALTETPKEEISLVSNTLPANKLQDENFSSSKKKKEVQNLPPEAVVQQSEEESFWTWKNILLILAAVGTLGIGAYFIIRYKKKADDAKSQSSALQSTVNDLQAQVSELQNPSNSANTSLASNNNGLSQSTALASVSTNITNTSANPVNTDLLGNDYSRK